MKLQWQVTTCRQSPSRLRRDVSVGAHVGYRDGLATSTAKWTHPARALIGDVIHQIGALQGLAKAAGIPVRYVKPHAYPTTRLRIDPFDSISSADPSNRSMCL
ncbi:LamB/YcsF family protein [Sinorhizobium meliloti]|uniref:LamB/YcsF family protein n=1 Tax=Rhizobium meliloti TaxID=382 RepID=UPI000FD9850C|nr:LamB/YcsF family protein [Sinorhizobium meliloti]RVO45665.1 hypothetical protein CN092_35630 [Sinorhizobium meliloti]